MRVHELAKELGVTSKEVIAALEEMGLGGRTASSAVPDEAVPRLRASGGHAVPGQRVRAAVEEPKPKVRSRAKPKAKPAASAPTPEPAASSPASAPAQPAAAVAEPVAVSAAEPVAQPAAARTVSPEEGPGAGSAQAPPAAAPGTSLPTLRIGRAATAQELADRTGRNPVDVVKVLMGMGEMASATTSLSDDALNLVGAELGYDVEVVDVADDLGDADAEDDVDASRLEPRPPVVTVMGHVDHGKTRLLDAIRSTDVVSGEFGGITQHIGAYQVRTQAREITFIDTPGHEAFTAMRARGAQVTDIVVLVVAADDGVMPQTVEALDHAKAAGVPIIVAVNKVDKPEADPQRARQQMVEHGVVPVEWGGETEFVDVSAKAKTNIDTLLETILLVADLEELKADPAGRARGTVIEANLDKGRGPVATALVQRGSLDVGDVLVSGTSYARIRAMQDENGMVVEHAGPSKPVLILGWSTVPNAGDDVREVADERAARHVAQERESRVRAAELVVSSRPPTLADLMEQAADA